MRIEDWIDIPTKYAESITWKCDGDDVDSTSNGALIVRKSDSTEIYAPVKRYWYELIASKNGIGRLTYLYAATATPEDIVNSEVKKEVSEEELVIGTRLFNIIKNKEVPKLKLKEDEKVHAASILIATGGTAYGEFKEMERDKKRDLKYLKLDCEKHISMETLDVISDRASGTEKLPSMKTK